MTPHDYLASPYQEAAVQQAVIHGFTYSRILAERCRLSPEAANGVLGALVFKKIFTPFPLWDRVNGFKLTRFACGVLDLSRTLCRLRGEQAYIFRTARLVDCERRQVRPFSRESLIEGYPALIDFTDAAERFVPGVDIELTALHVDHGGSADRAIARANAIASRYLKNTLCNRLVWAGRLGIRMLVPSRGKAEAIAQRFARAANDPLARIELDVVEDLQHLLVGRVHS